MITLQSCPVCRQGDLYRHCNWSPTCDLVECDLCKAKGTLNGRWWPNDAGRFAGIEREADELRNDIDDDEGRDI